MNVKQIICVAKMFVITSRTCVVCPQKCVANLHDKGKSNMAAIVNKVYSFAPPCNHVQDKIWEEIWRRNQDIINSVRNRQLF